MPSRISFMWIFRRTRSLAESTIGRDVSECGQIGLSTKQCTSGETIGPPAESE